MRFETYSLNVPATATTGTAFPCRNIQTKYVQIVGIAGGGVVKLEITIDGATWVKSGADVVADGIYSVPETADQIRVNRSTLGTGTWTATLAGFNVRPG